MKIVETDNFGGDYPNEKFAELPPMPREICHQIAELVNKTCGGENARRYWMVVDDDYKLVGGFEP